jgi:hypothetical protein
MNKRYAPSVSRASSGAARIFLKRFLATLFLLSGLLSSQAQVSITYPEQAEDVVTCNQDGDLRVRLRFTSNNADAPVVTINLPPGLRYQTGSLQIFGGNLNITESDLSDPEAPQFLVTPSDIAANDVVDFSITRSGGCDARDFAVDGACLKIPSVYRPCPVRLSKTILTSIPTTSSLLPSAINTPMSRTVRIPSLVMFHRPLTAQCA